MPLETLDPLGAGGGTSPARGGPVPPTRYPSYMDPRYVLAVARASADEVVQIGAGATVKVAGASMRYGLGFVAASDNTRDVLLAIRGDPLTFPFLSLAAGESVYLPLAQFGPLVCYEWYAMSPGAARLNVVSVELE